MIPSGMGLKASNEGRSRSSFKQAEGKVEENALKRLVMMVVTAAGVYRPRPKHQPSFIRQTVRQLH